MRNKAIWEPFTPYKSAGFVQRLLKKLYEAKGLDEPLTKSYQNGSTFSYYIEHGQKFFQQALRAPYEIKPVLLFYGAAQLLKACLLTEAPEYPESSRVLAHGVSTRKKKKSRYEFIQDTVQIQKSGLFSYAGKKLYQMAPMEGAKFKMEDLFFQIPELRELFVRMRNKTISYPIGVAEDGTLFVSAQILNDLQMSKTRFFHFLEDYLHPVASDTPDVLHFMAGSDGLSDRFPFLTDMDGIHYLPAVRAGYIELPEPLTHYLILYNLSMISRYETEWWSVLHAERSSPDLAFIHAFIDVTQRKFPFMTARWLSKQEQQTH